MTTPAHPASRAAGFGLAALAALVPVAAWLGPLALAPLMALAGIAAVFELRLPRVDLPIALTGGLLLAWTSLSMAWSPYRPTDFESFTALKVVLLCALSAAAICAARGLPPVLRATVLKVAVWGAAGLGLLLFVEGLTAAGIYRALRDAIHDPIRPDLAAKNVAQGAFVLAVIAPAAAAAGIRLGLGFAPGAAMAAGVLAACVAFGADAPVLALAVAAAAGLAALRWPRLAPLTLAASSAVFFITAPLLIWALRETGHYGLIEQLVPPSWGQRMAYWSHAIDWIAQKPAFGWGLDASRDLSGIVLHPHSAPLQFWLELGGLGASLAALLWSLIYLRLVREDAELPAAAGVATAVAYQVIAVVGFGVWQEWWIALGALAAVYCAALAGQAPGPAAAPRVAPEPRAKPGSAGSRS